MSDQATRAILCSVCANLIGVAYDGDTIDISSQSPPENTTTFTEDE